MNEFGN